MPTIIADVTALEMALGDGVLTPAQIEKAMIVGVKIKEALARTRPARGSRSARSGGLRLRRAVNPSSREKRPDDAGRLVGKRNGRASSQ